MTRVSQPRPKGFFPQRIVRSSWQLVRSRLLARITSIRRKRQKQRWEGVDAGSGDGGSSRRWIGGFPFTVDLELSALPVVRIGM